MKMYLETLNIKPLPGKKKMEVKTALNRFNLPFLVAKMKRSHSWANGELNAMVLLKSADKQIVLTVLHEGTEIISFQSNNSVTFQIIEGKLMFHTKKDSVLLDKGKLLTLQEKIRYKLISMEETVFLLTIATGTLQQAAN